MTVLVAVAAAGVFGYQYLRGIPLFGGSTPPPPDIYTVKPGQIVSIHARGSVAYCSDPEYDYWFYYPSTWTLSIPGEYTRKRSRMLRRPDLDSAAIIVLPFGLYAQDALSEIAKAETAYIGPSRTPTRDARLQINGHRAYRRTYQVHVSTPTGPENATVEAAYIISRPKCYAVFLRARSEDYARARPAFETVVASFHIEKMPLVDSGASRRVTSPSPVSPGPAASPSAPAAGPDDGIPTGKAGASPTGRPAPASHPH